MSILVNDPFCEAVLLMENVLLQFIFSIIASTIPVPSGMFIPVFKIGAAIGRMVGEALHLYFPMGIRYSGRISQIIPGKCLCAILLLIAFQLFMKYQNEYVERHCASADISCIPSRYHSNNDDRRTNRQTESGKYFQIQRHISISQVVTPWSELLHSRAQ